MDRQADEDKNQGKGAEQGRAATEGGQSGKKLPRQGEVGGPEENPGPRDHMEGDKAAQDESQALEGSLVQNQSFPYEACPSYNFV